MKAVKFKSLMLIACMLVATVCSAQSIMRGEITPANYGNIKTDSSGYLYTIATATTAPSTGTLTDRSGTITLGGTAQTIMAANATRKYLLIQNTSDTTMWCNFTTAAVATQPSFNLIPGASFVMEGTAISTEAVSCIGATTAKIFTAKEM